MSLEHSDTPDSKGSQRRLASFPKDSEARQMEEAATGQRWDDLSCNKGKTNQSPTDDQEPTHYFQNWVYKMKESGISSFPCMNCTTK